jgi:carbamoyltransferase
MKNLVLGLKLDPWHDAGAAVVGDDGRRVRVAAISEERLDRTKNSRAFPSRAIAYCLDAVGCRLRDVSLVVADYIVRPGVDDQSPGGRVPSSEAKAAFFRELDALNIPAVFARHHLCHAASAFFATSWDAALAVVIDGLGSDREVQGIFDCEHNRITQVSSSQWPGIGLMYTAVTERLLGFGHLQEGKTMGLAGHAADGASWTDLFRHQQADPANPCAIVYPQFADEHGPTWETRLPSEIRRCRAAGENPVQAPFAQYAFAAQAEVEAAVLRIVREAAARWPRKRLCYAGGVALNIPANRRILDSGLFDAFFVQPAASDAGIPLGAALLGHYAMLGGTRRWEMTDAFLGRSYAADVVDAAASRWPLVRAAARPADVARLLANDYLVAWYQGGAEYGPRALGHRSILCSPRHPRMKAYLNDEVKHREMFRPFAPIVPAEHQREYFDLPGPSPFMLLNARVRAHAAARIPAAVHADGTARVQTIGRDTQPELHALLHAVGALTGTPILVNTSLNLAGEPIVETPADALSLFERSRLDALVLGPHLLTKVSLDAMLRRPNPGLAASRSSADTEAVHDPLVA